MRDAGIEPRPWVVLAGLLLVSLAYNWYYLTGGFHADDLLLINLLREDPLRFSRWLGLWSIFDFPAWNSIWWVDPDVAGAFCRPLTSLAFEGSIRLFGETALPLHLLSIVLHGLVAWGLYLFVRRLTGRGLLAILLSVYHGKSAEQILQFDIESYFAELDLLAHLSATRGNGLRAMIRRIRAEAVQLSEQD